MTIEYVELRREELRPGYGILGRFTDTSTNETQTERFFVDGTLPTEAEINDKIESMKEYLEDKLGQTITFDEFKTYITNHKFRDVD